MIKKIFGFLFSPLLLTLLALIVVAVLVWWIGPLVKIGSLAPLESETVRAIVIGVIVLVVVLRALLTCWHVKPAVDTPAIDALELQPSMTARPKKEMFLEVELRVS